MTYEWLFAEPEKWQGFYGNRPTLVFNTRELPRPSGADVRFVTGSVPDALPAIRARRAAATSGWLAVEISLGSSRMWAPWIRSMFDRPVTLAAGAPLLPRRIDSTRLRLVSVVPQALFIVASYLLELPID